MLQAGDGCSLQASSCSLDDVCILLQIVVVLVFWLISFRLVVAATTCHSSTQDINACCMMSVALTPHAANMDRVQIRTVLEQLGL
jgi:hypothetical protein